MRTSSRFSLQTGRAVQLVPVGTQKIKNLIGVRQVRPAAGCRPHAGGPRTACGVLDLYRFARLRHDERSSAPRALVGLARQVFRRTERMAGRTKKLDHAPRSYFDAKLGRRRLQCRRQLDASLASAKLSLTPDP